MREAHCDDVALSDSTPRPGPACAAGRMALPALAVLAVCICACGGGPRSSTPLAPTPVSGRTDLAGQWEGLVAADNGATASMRLEWSSGNAGVASTALEGTWTWTDAAAAADGTRRDGTVRALAIGDPVLAIFTPGVPLACSGEAPVRQFPASVTLTAGRLVGLLPQGAACGWRRFDLTRR